VTKRRVQAAVAPSPVRVERRDAWSGVRAGDSVDVLDPREPRATWAFVAYVTNIESGDSWVEVVGGRAGDPRRRSFRPAQLYPYRSIRGGSPTAAPLCDAPLLNL
jgi:hypothetical protein